jgi:hypothetical protein
MGVAVTPTTFTMVDFDHAELTGLATRLATEIGLPAELDIVIEVIEQTPAANIEIPSTEPLRITIEGGALENPKRPRTLGEHRVVDVLGQVFHQVRDRLDPAFGAPALEEKLPLPHRVAWDVYALGRLERLGYDGQRSRRLYHFRNRHGFTDEADATFDKLWSGTNLTWERITTLSDEARSVAPTAG